MRGGLHPWVCRTKGFALGQGNSLQLAKLPHPPTGQTQGEGVLFPPPTLKYFSPSGQTATTTPSYIHKGDILEVRGQTTTPSLLRTQALSLRQVPSKDVPGSQPGFSQPHSSINGATVPSPKNRSDATRDQELKASIHQQYTAACVTPEDLPYKERGSCRWSCGTPC